MRNGVDRSSLTPCYADDEWLYTSLQFEHRRRCASSLHPLHLASECLPSPLRVNADRCTAASERCPRASLRHTSDTGAAVESGPDLPKSIYLPPPPKIPQALSVLADLAVNRTRYSEGVHCGVRRSHTR